MFGNAILDRIVDRTVELCREEGVITYRAEVEKILNHIINRVEYLFNLNQQKLIKVGYIEILNFGKFGTAEGFRHYRRQRKLNRLNKAKANGEINEDDLTNDEQ